MSRVFTLAAAGALAACIGATAWSQNAQSGGTAGASGSAGAAGASGGAGVSGSAGATGATGQAGANAAAAGQAGVAGQAGAVPNPNNVPGRQQFISPPPTGQNFDFNDPLRRPFFMDPNARRELNMNAQQFNQLNQARQETLMRLDQAVNQINSNPNLTPQQRAAQLLQLRAQFNQQFGQTVDTVFTDPRLRQRFNQLDRQFRPFAAFNDATVNQQLQLTPQQQRQLRQLGSRWRQQMQRLRRAGSNAANDPQAANEQFAAMQLQFQQQMQQIMTPQQWQTWNQLNGEPFNFPQTAFFPPDDDNIGVAQRPVVPEGRPSNVFVPKNVPQQPLVPEGTQQQNAPRNVPQERLEPEGTPQQNTIR
jgi:hypothetical protein